jgi:hypothetical protein
MAAIPELIKLSLFPLRHVEPMTIDALEFTGEYLEDNPTDEEISYYTKIGAEFQLVFVVINSIFAGVRDGVSHLLPFSLSLVPASKRGNVEVSKAGFVAAMRGITMFEEGAAYLGLDPFSGEWALFSQAGLIAEMGATHALTDELGLVYDYFFLRVGLDSSSITQPAVGIPESRLRQYLRHRSKLLYTPFEKVAARRIWGVENALELFVYQEFQRQEMPCPVPQALLFDDGTWQPALYHAWEAFDDAPDAGLISEADFLFPDRRIAVFCDGATHNRARIRERDRRIDAALGDLGFRSIRLSSKRILANVEEAVGEVRSVL